MSAKKYLMLMVKQVVRVLPKSFLLYLKRSPKLTSFYSRALVKSGLFYGRPSNKTLFKLYKKNLLAQQRRFNNLDNTPNKECFLIVVVDTTDYSSAIEPLHNVDNDFFAEVVFFCDEFVIDNLNKVLDEARLTNIQYRIVSNLEQIRTDLCVFIVNSGDRLTPEIGKIVSYFKSQNAEIGYVDRDFYSENGGFQEPEYYPDWNPDLQLSSSYIRTGVWLQNIELLHNNLSKKATYDFISNWFIFQFVSKVERNIVHLDLIGVVSAIDNQPFRTHNKELIRFLENTSEICNVKHAKNGTRHVKWSTKENPLVSLIIPTYNAKQLVKQCIDSILNLTTYPNYEIILVDNNSNDLESLQYFDELDNIDGVKVLKYPFPFNYSAINNFAVEQCNGDILGLINNDIEVISPDWLENCVGIALRSDVGCVGAKLLYPDDRIQHAGVVLGYGGGAGHAHKYFPRNHSGYLNRISATNNYSAVTAACLFVKREDYLSVGGLNESDLSVAFNDVDFCLRVLNIRARNVYCAEAELYHFESISRGADDTKEKSERFNKELSYLKANWNSFITKDPAYNSNLTLKRENFSIASSLELQE